MHLKRRWQLRSYVKFIERAHAKGYFVTLLYFWLPTPEQAIERVATRVSEGGHNIPSDVIRRRYANGIRNLVTLYTPICNFWTIYDNSSADAEIIEKTKKEDGELVVVRDGKVVRIKAKDLK